MSVPPPPKTLEEALKALERCGDARVRELNAMRGAPENQFGVKMGDIRSEEFSGYWRACTRPLTWPSTLF